MISETIIDVFPWPVTMIAMDAKKKSLTLKTLRNELVVQPLTDLECEVLFKQISERSLSRSFNEEYSILKYVGQAILGRLYTAAHREDPARMHLILQIPIRQIAASSSDKLLTEIATKLSTEVCVSFEMPTINNLVKIHKVDISAQFLTLLYDFCETTINLDAIMYLSPDYKREEVIVIVRNLLKIVLNFEKTFKQLMLEVCPKTILLTRQGESLQVDVLFSLVVASNDEYITATDFTPYFNPLYIEQNSNFSELNVIGLSLHNIYALFFQLLFEEEVFGNRKENLVYEESMGKTTKTYYNKIMNRLNQYLGKGTKYSRIIAEYKEFLTNGQIQGLEYMGRLESVLEKEGDKDATYYDADEKFGQKDKDDSDLQKRNLLDIFDGHRVKQTMVLRKKPEHPPPQSPVAAGLQTPK